MAPSSTDISIFAQKQLTLLAAEQNAEVAETALLTATHAPIVLQRAGLAILNLHVSAQRTGFGGKTIVELTLDPAVGGGELPEHGLRVGDICAIATQLKGSEKKQEREGVERSRVTGVITRVRREDITVALDKEDADVSHQAKLWLLKLANDATHKRLAQVMTRLSKLSSTDASGLINVLFGISSPTPLQQYGDDTAATAWNDYSLNDSQKDAIRFALASREIALIHGPPGTGKTHTVIELILQLIALQQRVLVCGPSNVSVDNIVERLASYKVPMVRLGHPARLLPKVLNHSLDVLTRTSDAAAIVRDIRSEMDTKQASVRKTRTGRERKAIYNDLKELRREFRERESRVVRELLGASKVVLTTLHGAGGHYLKDERFDIVIVDEASQALEAQCWIPVLSVKGVSKLILAGDHLQLPPTIKTVPHKAKDVHLIESALSKLDVHEAEQSLHLHNGKAVRLETTLFDRLLALHGSSIKRMLTTQYRMHEKIMRFPSKALYGNKLIAAESVKHRLLTGLPYPVAETEDTTSPLVFYDTQGGDFHETTEEESESAGKSKSALLAESKVNSSEAILAKQHVTNLVDAGVDPQDIAVVTPYNGQLAVLAGLVKDAYPQVELGSVDGFQGREKEAIIISLVRSNPQHEVGFLSEKRRLNGRCLTKKTLIRLVDAFQWR